MILFGFDVSDRLFEGNCKIVRRELTVAEVQERVKKGVVPIFSLRDKALNDLLRSYCGIFIALRDNIRVYKAKTGDSIIIARFVDLPERTKYSSNSEQDGITCLFSEYTVEAGEG